MLFFLSLFMWMISHASRVEIFAPELVVDEKATQFSFDAGYYGFEFIYSEAPLDWYSFYFFGVSTNDDVAGLIFASNPHENPDTDMLDRPIPFWYSTRSGGKARGDIYFREHLRKLCLTPPGEKMLCPTGLGKEEIDND